MRASGGGVLEFEEYVRVRQDALLRSARRLVPDPTDAQDLVQTALVRTYPRWEGIADKTLAATPLRPLVATAVRLDDQVGPPVRNRGCRLLEGSPG